MELFSKKIDTVRSRIIQFVEKSGDARSEFLSKTNLKIGLFDSKDIHRAVGSDKLSNILDAYPDLNSEWLLTGKGNMLLSDKGQLLHTQNETEEVRPHVPLNASAGSLAFISDTVKLDECEKLPYIDAMGKYTFTIQASGDSMMPDYHSGDTLACLKIEDNSFIQWGRTYVLDTSQGIVVKNIYDENDSIKCVSINEKYPPFNIDKSEVYGLALVVGLVRKY